MKKVIFFALVIAAVAWHTDIYNWINGIHADPVAVSNIGAPHSNNPDKMSSGPMGTAASEPDSNFDLTQWLKDHTPKQ